MTLGDMTCISFFWHRWKFVRMLSVQSRLDCCQRCGREWSTNYDTMITLPFDMVRSHYATKENGASP